MWSGVTGPPCVKCALLFSGPHFRSTLTRPALPLAKFCSGKQSAPVCDCRRAVFLATKISSQSNLQQQTRSDKSPSCFYCRKTCGWRQTCSDKIISRFRSCKIRSTLADLQVKKKKKKAFCFRVSRTCLLSLSLRCMNKKIYKITKKRERDLWRQSLSRVYLCAAANFCR